MKPLCIDLFCGLGGWAEGFLAEGYDVIGYDIEAHRYPKVVSRSVDDSVKRPGLNWSDRSKRGSKDAQFNRPPDVDPEGEWMEYPGKLILRDVRSIHGSECKDAAVIVASPPCQAYSYRAMPWKRAKALPPPDNTLFNECFRIQREASEAAGQYIPLIVENVRGAQKWVGRARWNYGSFYLWGDVPALMPFTNKRHHKIDSPHLWLRDPARAGGKYAPDYTKVPGFRFDGSGKSFQTASVDMAGVKEGGDWWNKECRKTGMARFGSKSNSRRAASAMIAKIPFPLAVHIARVFKPLEES